MKLASHCRNFDRSLCLGHFRRVAVAAGGFLAGAALCFSGGSPLQAASGAGVAPSPAPKAPAAPNAAPPPTAPQFSVADLHAPDGTLIPPGAIINVKTGADSLVVLASSKTIIAATPVKESKLTAGVYVVNDKHQLVSGGSSVPLPDGARTTWALRDSHNQTIVVMLTSPGAPPPSTGPGNLTIVPTKPMPSAAPKVVASPSVKAPPPPAAAPLPGVPTPPKVVPPPALAPNSPLALPSAPAQPNTPATQ